MHYHSYILIDVLVIIGLQQGYYSILESSNIVQVCVEVISGEIVERSIAIDYTTLDGSAEGINTVIKTKVYNKMNISNNVWSKSTDNFVLSTSYVGHLNYKKVPVCTKQQNIHIYKQETQASRTQIQMHAVL